MIFTRYTVKNAKISIKKLKIQSDVTYTLSIFEHVLNLLSRSENKHLTKKREENKNVNTMKKKNESQFIVT